MIFPKFHFRVERWKFNKECQVYVSTLGNFKKKNKENLPIKMGSGGYIMIFANGAYRLAHRVVMETWVPIPRPEELTVDHKNHNKRDNSLKNLEWVTHAENQQRAKDDLVIDTITPVDIEKKYRYYVDGAGFDYFNGAFDYFWSRREVKNHLAGIEKNKVRKKFKDKITSGDVTTYFGIQLSRRKR